MKRWLGAVVVVVGLVACSSPGLVECARNTCSGCCTADGECVLGQAQTACGSSGNQCRDCSGDGLVCGSGVCGQPVDAGMDAGHDAGTDAGVPMVFVTFRYDIAKDLVGSCPNQHRETEECGVLKSMTKAAFDLLRPEYGSCAVTQESMDGWTIDCTGNCFTQNQMCSTQAGGAGYFDETYCPAPEHALPGACDWQIQ